MAGVVAGLAMAVSASAVEESTFIWNPNLIALSSAIALAGAERVFEILDSPSEIDDAPQAASLEETAKRSEHHFAIARKIKPDVILLAHGAAIVDPEHAQAMRRLTSCHGVQLGSSIERMAIERPIETRTAAFKAAKPARTR